MKVEEVKEVQKTTRSSNLNFTIYQQIKQGLNPAKISKKFNIKKTTLKYYLSSLKRVGFIKKVGYGVWEIISEFDKNKFKQVQKCLKK